MARIVALSQAVLMSIRKGSTEGMPDAGKDERGGPRAMPGNQWQRQLSSAQDRADAADHEVDLLIAAQVRAADVLQTAQEVAAAVLSTAQQKAEAILMAAQEAADEALQAAQDRAQQVLVSAEERAKRLLEDGAESSRLPEGERIARAEAAADALRESQRVAADVLREVNRNAADVLLSAHRSAADVLLDAQREAAAMLLEAMMAVLDSRIAVSESERGDMRRHEADASSPTGEDPS